MERVRYTLLKDEILGCRQHGSYPMCL